MADNNLILQSVFICEKAFFSEDKKLNIICIFDQVFTSQFPTPYVFSLATVIKGNPKQKVELKIEGKSSNGENILQVRDVNVILSDSGSTNLVVNANVVFKEEGVYTFSILNTDKKLGEASLKVFMNKGGQNASGSQFSN